MTYTVQLHGITIGRTELEHLNRIEGIARGAFRPATGYQLVQDVFRLYAEALPKAPGRVNDPEKLQRYYRARDALGLQLLDPDSRTVEDVTVHVYERAGDRRNEAGGLEIEVRISDPVFWQGISG